jgi:hypothetical protein
MVRSVEKLLGIIHELKLNLIVNDVSHINSTSEARRQALDEFERTAQLKRERFRLELFDLLCDIQKVLDHKTGESPNIIT